MKKGFLVATLVLFGFGVGSMATNAPKSLIPNDLMVVEIKTDKEAKTITSYNKNGEEVAKMWL